MGVARKEDEMTKEEKKAVAALKKELSKICRETVKPYKYKVIDGTPWTVQNGMLFDLLPYIVTPLQEDKAYLSISCGAKPMFVDDILWEILGMEENKTEPASLRVNGAFSLATVKFREQRYALDALSREEIQDYLEQELQRFSTFLASVAGDELSWFLRMEAEKEDYYQAEVMRPILMLYEGKNEDALNYIAEHNVRTFIVSGKTVGELIAERCL